MKSLILIVFPIDKGKLLTLDKVVHQLFPLHSKELKFLFLILNVTTILFQAIRHLQESLFKTSSIPKSEFLLSLGLKLPPPIKGYG
jgi:hypothetical protein